MTLALAILAAVAAFVVLLLVVRLYWKQRYGPPLSDAVVDAFLNDSELHGTNDADRLERIRKHFHDKQAGK